MVVVLSVLDRRAAVLRVSTALSLANDVFGLDCIFVLGVLLFGIIGGIVIFLNIFSGLLVVLFFGL
jgi:hypothetical protein